MALTPPGTFPLHIALAEYEHLRESRQVSFRGSGKRFNFYLIVVAASPAALTLAAGATPDAHIWISGVLLLAIFGLGLVTFRRLIEFDCCEHVLAPHPLARHLSVIRLAIHARPLFCQCDGTSIAAAR